MRSPMVQEMRGASAAAGITRVCRSLIDVNTLFFAK
jgi:hypothetical protein